MSLATLEYDRLLAPGLHAMTLAQVKALCVTKFPKSVTRASIFKGLSSFLAELTGAGLVGDAWLDGSFVTQKLDPSDCDLVVSANTANWNDSKHPDLQKMLQRRFKTEHDQTKFVYSCDAYLFPDYPVIHQLHNVTVSQRTYWSDQFGFDRSKTPKGMAVVTLRWSHERAFESHRSNPQYPSGNRAR